MLPWAASELVETRFLNQRVPSGEPKTQFFSKINPTVQQAQLDAPMDSDTLVEAAQGSIHLLKLFSPFAEILSRCGEIRSDRLLLGTRSAENHEKLMVFIEFLDDAARSSQTEKNQT